MTIRLTDKQNLEMHKHKEELKEELEDLIKKKKDLKDLIKKIDKKEVTNLMVLYEAGGQSYMLNTGDVNHLLRNLEAAKEKILKKLATDKENKADQIEHLRDAIKDVQDDKVRTMIICYDRKDQDNVYLARGWGSDLNALLHNFLQYMKGKGAFDD